MRGDEHLERGSLLAAKEAEQSLGVFANVMVHVQKDVGTGFEFGEGARGDGDEIANAVHLDEHLGVGSALEHGAAQ